MNLARTSLLNGIAVLTKIGTTLFVNKLLAVYIGPSGYGLIGQFQSLMALSGALAGGALNTGVVSLAAQYGSERERQLIVWRTAATIGVGLAVAVGTGLYLTREYLARLLLGDAAYAPAITYLAVALLLIVLNGLMLAMLNGLKAVRSFVACNIAGSVIAAAVAAPLILGFGIFGALVAASVSQTIAFLVTLWAFRRKLRNRCIAMLGRIDPSIGRKLAAFALMALTSAMVTPTTHLLIRSQLATLTGAETAGLWQALNRLSEMHLMLLTTTFAVYLLPRLSEIREVTALRAEIGQTMRFVLVLVIGTSVLLFFFRDALITLLLTREFLALGDAMGLQLVGDILKMGSWVLAYTMISHGRTRTYIVTEVTFGILLTVLSLSLAKPLGLLGAAAGYAITYGLYWTCMYFVYRSVVHGLRDASAVAATKSRLAA